MGKMKLNLVSGAVIEKPLVNAFKANNNIYIVLDNEMNGSMGLPIILVCKFDNNRLTKIVDQNEWQIVKEYLKNIIAGNQIEFVKVADEIVADDIYYTQLTLPVPSFDALKNAYKVEEEIINNEVTVMDLNLESIDKEVEANIPEIPQVEIPGVVNNSVVDNPILEPVGDVPQSMVVEPVVDMNTPMPTFGEPITKIEEKEPMQDNVVMPELPVNPEINIFKDQKEAFMQACENMFDALVQKFERELENRK